MTYIEMALSLNKTLIGVETKCRKLGFYCKRKQREQTKVNHNFFKRFTSNMAYVFGYWFADGHIDRIRNNTYSFVITSKDKGHLDLIRNLMKSEHNIYDKGDGSFKFVIGSKTIWYDIQKLGGTLAKSLTAKFPQIPEEFIKDFIRGYFDGDGSLSLSKTNYPSISFLGTEDFLLKLQSYLPHQIIPYQKYKNDMNRSNKTFEMRFFGKNAKDILDFMYNKSLIFLNRKYKKYQQSLKWKGKERAKRIYGYDVGDKVLCTKNVKQQGYIKGKMSTGYFMIGDVDNKTIVKCTSHKYLEMIEYKKTLQSQFIPHLNPAGFQEGDFLARS